MQARIVSYDHKTMDLCWGLLDKADNCIRRRIVELFNRYILDGRTERERSKFPGFLGAGGRGYQHPVGDQRIGRQVGPDSGRILAPAPQARPITTTVIAFPVSLGLSSTVRKRNNAPIPNITKASVWLVPLNSATIAPTTPRRTRVLRSSRSESDAKREERGCHAITHEQATAKAKLRKSRNIYSGCKNCSKLRCMDSHESTCSSTPPPVFCFAISSAGLAANAVSGAMHANARTITVITVLNARPEFLHVRYKCDDMMLSAFSARLLFGPVGCMSLDQITRSFHRVRTI